LRDPFARLVPDRLAEPVGPPVRPWDVAAGGAGEAGPGGTALVPALDPRVWIKARISGGSGSGSGAGVGGYPLYSWIEVVSDDAAEPAGWAVPGGAASGTADARELNDNPAVPDGAVVWLRAADGPEGQAWAWEFAYEGAGASRSGCDPPSGVAPPGAFYYQQVCGSGSGGSGGTGSGSGCGTMWASCGNGCWVPILTGAPYCPGSGSGLPPAPPGTGGPSHLTPCCTDPVPADLYLTVSAATNTCLNGTFHLVYGELFPGDFRWLWNGTLCGKPCSWRANCQSSNPNTWTLAFVCDGLSMTVGSPSGSCVPFSVAGNCTVGSANSCVAAGTTFHAVLSE
jgi:hypothetical protein